MRYGTLSQFIDTAYIPLLQLERRNQGEDMDELTGIVDELRGSCSWVADAIDKPSRAQIAMHLMGGMMANAKWYEGNGMRVSEIAEYAVAGADALLAELKEGEGND